MNDWQLISDTIFYSLFNRGRSFEIDREKILCEFQSFGLLTEDELYRVDKYCLEKTRKDQEINPLMSFVQGYYENLQWVRTILSRHGRNGIADFLDKNGVFPNTLEELPQIDMSGLEKLVKSVTNEKAEARRISRADVNRKRKEARKARLRE